MDGQISYLPRAGAPVLKEALDVDSHPMRKVTQQVAFDRSSWDSFRAAKVSSLFDSMASTWSEKDFNSRVIPVMDCMDRGGVTKGALGVELGSGTGAYSDMLSELFQHLLCVDISQEMLINSRAKRGLRVRGDGALLPLADGSVDGLFLINTLLFPEEIERVLAPSGYVAWISTNGDQTPIYLSPEEVATALGDNFLGVSSEAGGGTWSVFRRS